MTDERIYEEERELTEVEKTGLPPQEELQRNEENIINALLAASDYKTEETLIKKVSVVRNKQELFNFRIRPLGEDELMRIRKSSTPSFTNPANKRLPKIEGELRFGEFRSKKIYIATIDEDKARLWDNPELKQSLSVKFGKKILEGHEIVDLILMAGEKDRFSDIIDEISGYDVELEEYAKN